MLIFRAETLCKKVQLTRNSNQCDVRYAARVTVCSGFYYLVMLCGESKLITPLASSLTSMVIKLSNSNNIFIVINLHVKTDSRYIIQKEQKSIISRCVIYCFIWFLSFFTKQSYHNWCSSDGPLKESGASCLLKIRHCEPSCNGKLPSFTLRMG